MIFVLIASALVLSNMFVPNIVEVAPGRVTLFNIVQNPPENMSGILSSITIGYYYQEGTYTVLSSYIENLAKRKKVKLTFESSNVTIIVKSSSNKSAKNDIIPDDIMREASYIAVKIASEVANCSSPSLWSVLSYNGEMSSGIKKIKYTKIGKGIFGVLVTCENNRKTTFLYLKMKVMCYKYVPVLKKPVFYGETIYPDDIELKKMDVLQILGTPASTQEAYYSKAKRTLKTGEILTLDDIKRKPDVIKGEILIAYVALPGIYVTTTVEALQDGYIGDTIRVRNLASGKILKGVLLRDRRVKILEVER